jgi:uncharacterized membrane protein YccC
MKQYYRKEETPLAFHKFFWYVSLPIGFIASIISMISYFSDMPYLSWTYAFDLVYYVSLLTLLVICFIGFFQWKSYAWYGVFIYLCIQIIYSLSVILIYAVYIPNEIGTAIGQFIAILIYAILIGIYYKKRRLLFFPEQTQASEKNGSSGVNSSDDSNPCSNNMPKAKYCRKCGFELLEDSDFCGHCGTAVNKE